MPKPARGAGNARVVQRARIRGMMKRGEWGPLEKEFRFKARFIKGPSGKPQFDWSSCPGNMYHILQVGHKPMKTRAFLVAPVPQDPDSLPKHQRKTTKRLRMRCTERLPTKERLWIEQGGRCYYCAQDIKRVDWTVDHLLPLSLGGTNEAANLKGACSSCNNAKGSMAEDEFWASKYLKRLQNFYMNGGIKYLNEPKSL